MPSMSMMTTSLSSKYHFNAQNFINCAFYSAIASLYPFLNTQLTELGLSWTLCAWINSIAALFSMLGPLCLGPLAHKLSAYKQTLVLVLVLAFFSITAMLFIPKVISSEHTPKMYFDCKEGVLRVEQCPNWDGQCHTYPKRPVTNFSSFEIVTCSYVCRDDKMPINSSWYPVNVCFQNSNDPTSLCLDVQKEKIIPTDISLSKDVSIQFDSRFDRWPIIETQQDPIVERMFDGLRTCTFKPAPPLLMMQKVYSSIECRPHVSLCNIYCSINLRHRTNGNSLKSGQTRVRPPSPCQRVQGNPKQTFYLYLLFRCLADLSLLTAHSLIEAIRVANTNQYDSIYGGFQKFWTSVLPFIIWPTVCGTLSDYFVEMNAPDYAPPIVIFDGFIVIAIFLIVMLPLDSTTTRNSRRSSISSSNLQQKLMVLQPTKFRYPRIHSNQYLLYRLVIVIPLVLVLGSFWGLTESLIRPFYRKSLHSSNFLIGFSTSLTFLATSGFAYIAKSVIIGIGRMNLILLAFIFYGLRCAGTSFLVWNYQQKNWLLLPFEMMSSFCLPLTWIGITSYSQHLIKRSPNALSYATGTTIFQTYSPHVIMQYTINLMHFGGGRALGSAFASIWLKMWPDIYHHWLWLTNLDQQSIDSYALESIISEDIAIRILLRFVAILSLAFGLMFACLYHSCCFNCLLPHHDPKASMMSGLTQRKHENNYSKLKSKSENEVYPLKSKNRTLNKNKDDPHQSKQTKMMPPSSVSNLTRSMVTIRENLESSVDDSD